MNEKSLHANGAASAGQFKMFLKRREVLTFYILVAIWVIFSLFNRNYASINNLCSIMKTLSFFGIIAVGLSFVFIQGDMDISTGAEAGFGAVFGTALMLNTSCMGMQGTAMEWLGITICIAFAMAFGMVIGALNAVMVVKLNMPGFIATTAMKFILDGGVLIITGGSYVYPLPDTVNKLGKLGIPVGRSSISVYFLFFILLLIIAHWILNYTKYGRSVYETGSNIISAKLAGIKTDRIRFANFMALHALCVLAGLLNAAYIAQGSTSIGTDWELLCIAACAIGGIKMGGGAGNMAGLLIGVFALFSINSAIAYIGINTFLQDVIIGVILVIIVVSDKIREKRKIAA